MRISDWSSDVCSSDLRVCQRGVERRDRGHLAAAFGAASVARGEAGVDLDDQRAARRCGIERPDGHAARKAAEHAQIGRGYCRERGCQPVSVSVVHGSYKTTTLHTQTTRRAIITTNLRTTKKTIKC